MKDIMKYTHMTNITDVIAFIKENGICAYLDYYQIRKEHSPRIRGWLKSNLPNKANKIILWEKLHGLRNMEQNAPHKWQIHDEHYKRILIEINEKE